MTGFRYISTTLVTGLFCLVLGNTGFAQNIFIGERVMVVGAFNGYATTPYGTDYRTTSYRRLSVTSGTPTDGRGQWSTTINVQNSGGDVTPVKMAGGNGNGFLFISGPAANRFLNKWVFSGIGQGTLDALNVISAFNSGNDMGLNMSATGHYTFVFNDCGYTPTNARYYVGLTTNAPVTVSRSSQNQSGPVLTIGITTSATPSPQEKIYVRYTTGTEFSGTSTSSVVQASGSGTDYTASFPVIGGTTYRYFIFTSTLTLGQLSFGDIADFGGATEPEKSLAALRYDDNAGANYLKIATTAAGVSVTGRVLTADGKSIPRARVIVTNQNGQIFHSVTNSFGYYRFEDLAVGENYVFEVRAKQFDFSPRVVVLNEALDNFDLVAEP